MSKQENEEVISQEDATKFLAVGHKVFVRNQESEAVAEARRILSERKGSSFLGKSPVYGEGVIVAIRVWHDLDTLFEKPHRAVPVFDVQGEGWKLSNLKIDDLELLKENIEPIGQ